MELLEYEKEIFLESFQEDGLLVMAKGLGLERIFVNFLKLYCEPTNLVLVLNTSPVEEEYFKNVIRESLNSQEDLLPKTINSNVSINDRQNVYSSGGCLFMSSRILVVDMLVQRIPIHLISGILVYKAHRVIDSCQEAFILRLYRQKNKTGFIKAFSESAWAFTTGFCKVERAMKSLYVSNLFLWPRFRSSVVSLMEQRSVDVVELHIPMTHAMLGCQAALVDLVDSCIKELKRANLVLETEEIDVEAALTSGFDKLLKLRLDPIWHQLSQKTRQIVADLKMLRSILQDLTQYDCVNFYNVVNSLKTNQNAFNNNVGWLFTPAAEKLWQNAKERINSRETGSVEICPKWIALGEILDEIDTVENESNNSNKKNNNFIIDNKKNVFENDIDTNEIDCKNIDNNINNEIPDDIASISTVFLSNMVKIFLIARDERTCSQISQYLCNSQAHLQVIQGDLMADVYANQKWLPSADQNLNSKSLNLNKDVSSEPDKKKSKIEIPELNSNRNFTKNTFKKDLSKNKLKIKKQCINKKKFANEENEKSNHSSKFKSKDDKNNSPNSNCEIREESDNDDELISNQNDEKNEMKLHENDSTNDQKSNKLTIFLHSFENSDDPNALSKTLNKLEPKYIIIYDPDMKVIRQIEIFKACRSEQDLRVYFLVYAGSTEEQRYLTLLRKEKQSFEILIKEKSVMVIPEERDGKQEKLEDDHVYSSMLSTRKGGLPESYQDNSRKVIVDMREFRSELPSLLHKRGLEIEPITIEVGDYILTPDICVERKSVSDLIGSLGNGRLYNQCLAMCRAYRRPVLLIEFNADKPFSLQEKQRTTFDTSLYDIMSKLSLLTLHFPKLRLLWCQSPHVTAELFEELKTGRDEPSANGAILASTESNERGLIAKYNSSPQDMLSKMPGITTKNIYSLMNYFIDMADLCKTSLQKITDVLGSEVHAKQLFNFLHCSTTEINQVFSKGQCSKKIKEVINSEISPTKLKLIGFGGASETSTWGVKGKSKRFPLKKT